MKKVCFIILLGILWGCTYSEYESTPQEYRRVWNATRTVLTRNGFMVQNSRYRETMTAVSQISSDFLSKTRIKVVARVIEDEEGYYTPEIRVINQIDDSEPYYFADPGYPGSSSSYRPSYKWRNLTYNENMEAKLLNEVYAELTCPNPISGKGFKANAGGPPAQSPNKKEQTDPHSFDESESGDTF